MLVKYIFKLPNELYIKGTLDYGVMYFHSHNFKLHGYFDSDWAGCIDDMRSTSGYYFSFDFGVFSWCSKKQEVVVQSTTEAEYVVVVAAMKSGSLD